MMAGVRSASFQGIEAYRVEVEVDVSFGLPRFTVVGLPDQAVKESKERVRSAIKNSGFPFPSRRITVNLAPANIKKEGPAFDLPIALGILAATEVLPHALLEPYVFLGELALDGSLRKIRGGIVLTSGLKMDRMPVVLPHSNATEASLEREITLYPVRSLRQVVDFLTGKVPLSPFSSDPLTHFQPRENGVDFSEVKGQSVAKRAIEIAVAGGHNLLMMGPPGSGKTMLARRIPTLLPPLAQEEALEITKIYSVAGLVTEDAALLRERPFRAPHSSISQVALTGGGTWPKPGEISLAHGGVLFLDEFPEFHRDALEALRTPLEDGEIRISRAKAQWSFPARFLLVAAMNPCPCGWLGDSRRMCQCSLGQIQKYHTKISGPILDRIDLQIEVPAVSPEFLLSKEAEESSSMIRERILEARGRQALRFLGETHRTNHSLRTRELRNYCSLDTRGERLVGRAIRELGLTARSYFKLLKIARTIADLAGEEHIHEAQVAEAIQYRTLDRQRNT